MAEGGEAERISTDDLLAETENIRFDFVKPRLEEGIDYNLKIVDDFYRESTHRLSVIPEERNTGVLVESDDDEESGDTLTTEANKDIQEGTQKENDKDPSSAETKQPPDEEQNAIRIIKDIRKSLKNIRSFKINEKTAQERGGHYRLRTSSAPVNTERPLSSYPILETTSHQSNGSLQTPNCPKPSGQKFDIHNLEEEIINLQNMIKSSDLSRIPLLPCSATVTPPCTPAETSTAHSPTHTENHNKWNNSHPQNATGVKPPPKPPRLYLPREKNFEELKQSNEFDPRAHKVSNQHPNDLLSPDGIPGSQTITTSASTVMSPPKPPRQYSEPTKDNLILHIGKLSKSMGNLSDSVETQGKTIPSPRTPQVLIRDVAYAGRQFGEKKEKSSTEHLSVKIGKVFSKFSFRKNTNRRSRDICIGAPTDFKHIARGEADAENATDDRTLLVSNEQPLSTIKTESKVSSETEETFDFATQKVEGGGEEKGEGGEINSAFTETERDLPKMQVNPIENGSISK